MEAILLTVLVPAVTWIAVKVATLVKSGLPDVVVTTFIVPIASGLVTWVGSLVIPDAPWYVLLLIGLASTFLQEFLKNLGRAIGDLVAGQKLSRMGTRNDSAFVGKVGK